MINGKLYVIGAPIGNKKDASTTLIESISYAKYICVEDSERFKEFCNKYNLNYTGELIDISWTVESNRENQYKEYILNLLISGKDVHIISDEGMPSFADPGFFLVEEAIKNNIEIIASPGPSTIISAAVVSNIINSRFIVEGFLPTELDRRKTHWQFLKEQHIPSLFLLHNPMQRPKDLIEKIHITYSENDYNSFIQEAIDQLGPTRQAVLCIDLTCTSQKIIRGTLQEIQSSLNEVVDRTSNLCIVIK